ncbi:MAG: hypothetical protein E6Q36_10040 [Chryseobacterium sp.]|nr:MAG: hypothetical protein E6Q36_10040 [Chryseobacterium sp.]
MGLGNNEGGQSTWLKIANGKLYLTSDKTKENPFSYVSGIVTGMYFKEEKWEDTEYEVLNVQIRSGESKYILTIRVESGYFATFVNFFASVDPKKEVKINPMEATNDQGKKKYTLFVSQDGVTKAKYTRDSPDGPPSFEKVTLGKKVMYDTSKFTEFWKNKISKFEFSQSEQKPRPEPQPTLANNADDDLPF